MPKGLVEAEDVRRVEALALPADGAPLIAPEGFQADAAELETATSRRQKSALRKGSADVPGALDGGRASALSTLAEKRTGAGWLAVAGLILYLLGSGTGRGVVSMERAVGGALERVAAGCRTVAAGQGFRAWRQGADLGHTTGAVRCAAHERRIDAQRWIGWVALLSEHTSGHLRRGASGERPLVALATLHPSAAFRPRISGPPREWSRRMGASSRWCSNRNCARVSIKSASKHILTPRQRDGGQRAIDRLVHTMTAVDRPDIRTYVLHWHSPTRFRRGEAQLAQSFVPPRGASHDGARSLRRQMADSGERFCADA